MVIRIMTPYCFLKQDIEYPATDGYSSELNFFSKSNYNSNFSIGPTIEVRQEAHTELIRELGAAGIVLLKNVNKLLPLRQSKNIGVSGNDAADSAVGQYSLSLSCGGTANGDYDIGTLAVGGGSGTGRFNDLVPPLEAIKARGRSYGALVQYITDNDAILGGALSSMAPLPLDVCMVFLKSWATEGLDRTTLVPEWSSTNVVESVAGICRNAIVILHGASPNVLFHGWKIPKSPPFSLHTCLESKRIIHMWISLGETRILLVDYHIPLPGRRLITPET